MTIAADTQVEFRGLRLDGAYEIQQIDGLAGAPDVRTSDLTLSGRDGVFVGSDLLGGRTITIDLAVYAWDQTTFAAAVQALREAFRPGGTVEYPLSFRLPGIGDGSTLRVNCRARRLALPLTPLYWAEASFAAVELFASNPLLLSDAEQVVAIPLVIVLGGGHTWNQTWPNSWGGAITPPTAVATNAGNVPADVTYRIDGPVVNPRIENLTTGATFTLELTVADGDHIVVDTAARTVVLNDVASRYHTVVAGSTWPTLTPGSNTLRFGADTSTTAQLVISWRNAWL